MDTKELQHIIQLFKDTHPRPAHVTQKQAAEMLHMSEPTVRKLILAGSIKLNDAGMIPITEIDKFTIAKAA